MVRDFFALKAFGYDPAQFTVVNNLLYFTLFSYRTGRELWRSDGTRTGTYLVKDIAYYSYEGPGNLTPYRNKLYFSTDDGTGRKLWVCADGTAAGTTLVGGNNDVILRHDYDYNSVPFAVSNGNLYFPGYTLQTGWELYKYNDSGTAGVELVRTITGRRGSTDLYTADMKDVNDTLYLVQTAKLIKVNFG